MEQFVSMSKNKHSVLWVFQNVALNCVLVQYQKISSIFQKVKIMFVCLFATRVNEIFKTSKMHQKHSAWLEMFFYNIYKQFDGLSFVVKRVSISWLPHILSAGIPSFFYLRGYPSFELLPIPVSVGGGINTQKKVGGKCTIHFGKITIFLSLG